MLDLNSVNTDLITTLQKTKVTEMLGTLNKLSANVDSLTDIVGNLWGESFAASSHSYTTFISASKIICFIVLGSDWMG